MTTNGWRVDLFLFVPQLDNEHREIVRQGDDFCRALTGGRPKNEINVLLAKFIDAVHQHFLSEEKAMLATGYEGYLQHRAEHRRLMAQLFSLAEGFACGAIDDSSDALVRFAGSWCDDHIRVADSGFARFLHDNACRNEAAGCGARRPAAPQSASPAEL